MNDKYTCDKWRVPAPDWSFTQDPKKLRQHITRMNTALRIANQHISALCIVIQEQDSELFPTFDQALELEHKREVER